MNWTDTDFGRGAADKARKLAEKFVPLGLVVVLRDTHNRSADEILCAQMRRYPGSPSRFVRNLKLPIVYQDNGPPPDVAMVDVDGKLIVAGSYTVDFGRAEKLVKSELKKHRSGWGQHPSARKARALLFGKKRLADAMQCCDEALAAEPGQAELLGVRLEVEARFALLESAVHYHMEQGEYALALSKAEELRQAVGGQSAWEEQVDQVLALFETPEALRELELDKRLTTLLRPLRKKAPRQNDVKKLRKLAEEAGDSRVGRRAKKLARIAGLAAG